MSSRLQTARTIAGTVLLLFQIAAGQQSLLKNSSPEAEGQSSVTPDVAGGASSPDHDEMGNRRPLYRLRQSDTVDINFSFAPEFNQTITVRPDGFVSLRELPDAYVAGLTVSELQRILVTWYASRLHQPEITVPLKDLERPYFIVSGQVAHPGRYELRGPLMATEGVAIAGGLTDQSKHSQVVLFRRYSDEEVQARLLDMKHMFNSRNLQEDLQLKPGDVLFIPQNRISKIRKFLPMVTLSTYLNPIQF